MNCHNLFNTTVWRISGEWVREGWRKGGKDMQNASTHNITLHVYLLLHSLSLSTLLYSPPSLFCLFLFPSHPLSFTPPSHSHSSLPLSLLPPTLTPPSHSNSSLPLSSLHPPPPLSSLLLPRVSMSMQSLPGRSNHAHK